jgi:hypothetical protein
MYVEAVKCLKCKSIVFSRARHDFRTCECGDVSIDGGFDYCKLSHKTDARMEFFLLGVSATPQALYDDWNNQRDKFGSVNAKDVITERRKIRRMKGN